MFISHILARKARVEEDLIDQLFNSTEKRLARVLLLANFGKDGSPEPILAEIKQETLAEMVGTTRGRVNHFMNKFRDFGVYCDLTIVRPTAAAALKAARAGQAKIRRAGFVGTPAPRDKKRQPKSRRENAEEPYSQLSRSGRRESDPVARAGAGTFTPPPDRHSKPKSLKRDRRRRRRRPHHRAPNRRRSAEGGPSRSSKNSPRRIRRHPRAKG